MNTFETTVQRRLADGWPVIVTHSADDGSLPLRAEGILQVDLAELLAETIDAEAYGTLLGRALFRDNVRDAFSIARGATRDADALHVLLTVEDPELRTLYWQRLCAPVNRRWAFLALDPQVAFSQYLPSVSDLHFSSFGRRDLRALVVVANPANLDEYDLDLFDADGTIASVTSALGEIPADVLALGDGFAGPPTLDAMAEPGSRRSATPCCTSSVTAGSSAARPFCISRMPLTRSRQSPRRGSSSVWRSWVRLASCRTSPTLP